MHPIDGTLDLHTFRPNDIHSLIPEYLNECRRSGINRVRIIHGKGSGKLRKGVQDLLKKIPEVRKYMDAPSHEGGWGASIVFL
jgi:dsDNA-specific endonuclease/ATPase MutS2